MQRVKLGIVCLSWLFMAGAVSAQSAVDPSTDSGIAAVQNVSGGGVLQGTYFDVRHVLGDGVGYQNSYSQIGAFTPFWLNEDSFVAPNARLIITNSTQTGVNAGLVGRQYLSTFDRIIGAYGYYDNDQDARNFRYSQVTVGAETLGRWWDLRANGYFQTGTTDNFIQALGVSGNPYYVGNNIAFLGQQQRDGSLGGADIEFGMPVSPYTQWLRGYSGIYGYRTGNSETIGYRGRLEAMVSNDLTLSVQVSQDALYGTNVNGMVDFKFSGFQPTRYFPNLTTRQRMLNPVQRNWRIATHTFTQGVNIDAINPATGKPYFVTHVNNLAAPGGNGTIEHPFQHLQTSAPADIILVHRGNATTFANAVTGSAVLTNNQRLLGDGILSTVQLSAHYGADTINGLYNLPQTSNTGIYPYVTNPAGNIVTLANNNEVAGLNLIGSGGTAITNTAAGSNNFNLHNLEIAGNAGQGISLTNASGIGIINSINVGTTDHANPLGLGNNTGGGIQISSANPGLNLMLANVNMNASPAGSQAFGLSLATNTGDLNVNMDTVNTNGNLAGIYFGKPSQQLTAVLNNVRSNDNTNVGIQVEGTGGSITLITNNVAAMRNGGDNLEIGTKAAPIVTSTVIANLNDANFSNSLGGSGIVFSQSGGIGLLNLPNGVVFGNAANGLAIYGSNSAVMTANVQNGQFSSNGTGAMMAAGNDAFHVEGSTAATINLNVDPTVATNSGRDGLYYNMGQDSVLNATFFNTNLNNSGRSAVHGDINDFATANLYFNKTTGANSGGDGFYLNATNGSIANLTVLDGTFANSGRFIGGSSAINIQANNSSVNLYTDNSTTNNPPNFSFAGNIQPNGAAGNQAYGLKLNLQNSSSFNGEIDNGDLSSNLQNAINANVTSSSVAFLTLFNSSGNKSGSDGFVANVDHGTFVTNFTNSNFNQSGRYGMNFDVTNGGTLNSTFNNSTFNNSVASGINGIVNGTSSVAAITLNTGSTVNNSGNSGVGFNVNGGSLFVTATDTSLSNNGAAGVIGSGVLGVVTNLGTANLDFENTAINNNLDNGVFVTTTTGANVNAKFNLGSVNNNGRNSPTPLHHNDGIRLVLDGSPNSSLQLLNNVTVNGNGSDGVAILATNSTNFTGVFTLASIMNNGAANPPSVVQNGAGLEVSSATNSNVGLTLSNVTMGNTAAGGTQQYGLLASSSTAGQLTTNISNSDLSNNFVDAINSTVSTASKTNISLFSSTADNSKSNGALFDVNTGGQLNFNSAFSSTIINSGGSGILAVVDGTNSVANFDMDSITLSGNGVIFGGQGFSGLATNGANLNAVITNSSILTNSNQGIEINAASANTVVNFHVGASNVSFNNSEGLLINVSDQAQVNYRSNGSNYNNNGFNGTLDGVNVNVVGNGAVDSATAILLFANGQVDSNFGNGFNLNASNGATLTTSIQNMNISNNAGFGIAASAFDANTKFNLLMSGTNTMTGNTLGSFSPLIFNGINQVILDLTGSFSNPTGDGVHIDLQNIVNAEVAIQGPGTIDNSGGNGIYVNMNTVTNGSLLVNNVTEINNSLLDGIQANFTNVTNGAIMIEGPTTINNSGNDAVNINLTNSNLVNNLAYGGATIQVLTLTDNLPTPLNNQLPIPVTFNLNALGLTPTNALVIDGVTANGSIVSGISVAGTNSNIAANGSFITNNTVVGSQGGDGLHLNFNTVTADGLIISGNGFQGNSGNGMNIELFNTPIDGLKIVNNVGGATLAPGTLDFTFNNLIWTTFMNNNSTAGLNIAQVSLNLAGSTLPQVWRPDLTPFVTPPGFGPTAPTDVTVGLDSVDGVAVTPGNYPVQDTSGNVLPFGGIPVDSSIMTLGFNNFTPGSQFEYSLAHGPNSPSNTLYSGGQFTGATGTVTLADGRSASGVFDSTGLHINKVFGASSAGISGNGLDGIRLNLNNSSLTNLVISGNTLQSNGPAGGTSGNGIEFTGASGAVVNSDITNAQITQNTITANNGDGIKLVNPTTVGNSISAAFTGNTITSNTGTGVNLSLVTGAQNLHASFDTNTISSNIGGPGVNIHLGNNANYTGDIKNNTINSNGTQGVNINMGTNGVVLTSFTNNAINGNLREGVNINLGTGGQFNDVAFYGNTIGTNALPNGSLGVRLTVPDLASFNWNLGYPNQAANSIVGNTGAGVGITMTGASTGTLNVTNTLFANTKTGADPNFNGEGLNVNQSGSSTLNGSIVSSSFTNNAGDGALFTVTGNNVGIFATLNNFTVGSLTDGTLGNNFSNNGANGLEFFRTADGEIGNAAKPIQIGNNLFDSNGQNGLVIRSANKYNTDYYTINNNDMSKNTGNGVLFDERADANISADMAANTITNNSQNGIRLIQQFNAGVDLRGLSGTWIQNVITGNKGDGIDLNGPTGNPLTAATLTIGDATDTTFSKANVIANNSLNGIEVTSSGTLTVGNNVIQGNGTLGNLNTAAENAGILMNLNMNGATGTSTINIVNNQIVNNFGDAVQYQVAKGFDGWFTQLNVDGNTITNNSGRGVNIINRQDNFLQADVSNNFISANGLEGVYVVNTSSRNQDVWVSSTTPLLADADVFRRPDLQLRVVGNQIIGNGLNSGLSGTGLVVRVGTSNGGGGPQDTGGFASTGTSGAVITQGASAATFFGNINSQRGGVVAQIDNNTLGGNFGNDVLFNSFVSTVAPITAAGTWDNTQFTVTAYQSDPLSRFDLYFRGNTTDAGSSDLNGTSLGGYGARNPALVAFYNDSDGVFKSRLNNIAAPNIAGPFNSATRARNATRQAARLPNFSAPGVGPGLAYLYPGIGASTWRVSTDSVDNTNFLFNGFNVDTAPYTTTNDASGFNLGGVGNNGELPYGFGTY